MRSRRTKDSSSYDLFADEAPDTPATDILKTFAGAKVISTNAENLACAHCGPSRHAKIVHCIWPDRQTWACHECGREVAEVQSP